MSQRSAGIRLHIYIQRVLSFIRNDRTTGVPGLLDWALLRMRKGTVWGQVFARAILPHMTLITPWGAELLL